MTRGRSVLLRLSNSLNSLRAETKGSQEEEKKRSEEDKRPGERGVKELWKELENSL